jgi:hypothetical protein
MFTQDRCIVCVERTIGLEIIAQPKVVLHDVGQVDAHSGPFGYSINLEAR